jgi:AcrR family transcriptional regulator
MASVRDSHGVAEGRPAHPAIAADPGAAPLTDPAERPLRADARRNREKILKAARAAFADRGRDAQMDDVARRAKVGVGTVYRHFPTKEALVHALVVDKFERLCRLAADALEEAEPWPALERFIWRAAEQMAEDRVLSETIFDEEIAAVAAPEAERLQVLGREVIVRAKAAGGLRADFDIEDFGPMMCGLGAAMRFVERDRTRWERYLRLMIDGLRAPAPVAGAAP